MAYDTPREPRAISKWRILPLSGRRAQRIFERANLADVTRDVEAVR
jgi:hypothetical protein